MSGQGSAELLVLPEEEHLRPMVLKDAAVGSEREHANIVDEQPAARQGDRVACDAGRT